MNNVMLMAAGAGVLALIFAAWRAAWVKAQDGGDEKMQKIAGLIRTGAMAFLVREYKVLAIFVAIVAVLLVVMNVATGKETIHGIYTAGAFIVGAFCSGLAGFFGMRVATLANHRTTSAARLGLPQALAVAFAGGSVMGMSVVGLGLLGLSIVLMALHAMTGDLRMALELVAGFSMGASSIALFARVGGGIYTKAADVGADLVGKVESGLPEDDPRNPATIADNVGDNVGDVAGMGADLFESYIGAIVGAMLLGASFTLDSSPELILWPVLLPLLIAAVGIVASIVGTFFVRTKEGGNPQHALDFGSFGSAAVVAIISYFLISYGWADVTAAGHTVTALHVWFANAIGLAVGVAVGIVTSFYCSIGKRPVLSIANSTKTGPATTIITGVAVGMESTAIPLILIAFGTVLSFHFAGLYGVAIAALGMLSTTGIQLAVDAYGPIADNAGGIAEMTHQPPEVRGRTDLLDAVGNTTAAIGKGFAIASAAMTALALFSAYMHAAGLSVINLARADVMAAIFLGGMLPFLFSAMAMLAVGRSAGDMVEEVRRQFREIKGLLEGEADPDTARCVDISTRAAIREMVLPGILAVASPVVVGFCLGTAALAGLLAGCTVAGVLLAIFMSNSGGAWDNAKKSFEGEGFRMYDGTLHPKKSPAHDAAVVGDTVGDPFKDTAGPSLNILIKLMSVVALVIAPVLVTVNDGNGFFDIGSEDPVAAHAASVGGEGHTGDSH